MAYESRVKIDSAFVSTDPLLLSFETIVKTSGVGCIFQVV
jgi:hypothetical protein